MQSKEKSLVTYTINELQDLGSYISSCMDSTDLFKSSARIEAYSEARQDLALQILLRALVIYADQKTKVSAQSGYPGEVSVYISDNPLDIYIKELILASKYLVPNLETRIFNWCSIFKKDSL
jgi:hypothetical protein